MRKRRKKKILKHYEVAHFPYKQCEDISTNIPKIEILRDEVSILVLLRCKASHTAANKSSEVMFETIKKNLHDKHKNCSTMFTTTVHSTEVRIDGLTPLVTINMTADMGWAKHTGKIFALGVLLGVPWISSLWLIFIKVLVLEHTLVITKNISSMMMRDANGGGMSI
jgi:hypothetical protein